MKVHFSEGLKASGEWLHESALEHSFRSSPAILEFVDAVFQANNNRGMGGTSHHVAYHENMPGRVDLWPPEPAVDDAAEREWFDATDKLATNDPRIVLAEKIAVWVEQQCSRQMIWDESGGYRRIHPG